VRTTDRGREVYALAREFAAETETCLTERLGPEKIARLRALLEELGAAL
jgi:hypothetical protein